MYLLYLGLTHKEVPLEILEKVHFSDGDLKSALTQLKKEKSILENVIISTCNRTELYLVVDQLHTGRYYAKHFLADWFRFPLPALEKYLKFKEEDEVLTHLFRVATGLDSKILGETQILGQIKQAFFKAQTYQTTGIILNQVFKQVLTFAKRMHENYRINARPISIGLTALQLLDSKGLDYENKTVAVIGLGEIGQLVTKYVKQRPFKQIFLVNRTISKADPFLADARVTAHSWKELTAVTQKADILFSAVKSESYILFPHMLKKEAIVFDLCLPRTCHPSELIQLFNIEQLTDRLDQYQDERRKIAASITGEIGDEVQAFNDWKRQLGIVPLIKEIREHALKIQAQSMESLMKKLPNLTARESKVISKHMKGIVNQLIKEPILQLKELSVGEYSEHDIFLVAKIFGLQDKEMREYDESHSSRN